MTVIIVQLLLVQLHLKAWSVYGTTCVHEGVCGARPAATVAMQDQGSMLLQTKKGDAHKDKVDLSHLSGSNAKISEGESRLKDFRSWDDFDYDDTEGGEIDDHSSALSLALRLAALRQPASLHIEGPSAPLPSAPTRADLPPTAPGGGEHGGGGEEVAKHEEVRDKFGHVARSEHHVSEMAAGVAATLLGAMVFIMALYYVLNHPDADIRRYSYETVSQTVAIFTSILFFQGLNNVLESIFEDASLEVLVGINMVHFLFWLLMTQVWLAYMTGVIGSKPESVEKMELNSNSWAVLLAHITGFACLNAFGTIQHLPFVKDRMLLVFGVVIFAAFCLTVLEQIMRKLRMLLIHRSDGEKDEYEKAWVEETKEAEDDVMGFALSFLTVQALRFLISGHLPNPEGEDSHETKELHTMKDIALLSLCGFGFVIVLLIGMHRKYKTKSQRRVYDTMIVTCCMGFAWCTFYATLWLFESFTPLKHDHMLLAVGQAVAISLVAFIAIFFLDKLADADFTGDEADAAIIQVIGGISILVGFSWEQCFHHATHDLSLYFNVPIAGQLMLISACIVIVVPAWRWYLMPMVVLEGWRFGFVVRPETMEKVVSEYAKRSGGTGSNPNSSRGAKA